MKKLAFLLAIAVLSSFSVSAQKEKSTDLYVKVKDNKNPLIFVNGKKFDFPMELINHSKIKSINVLKNEEAKKSYNTSNGVILITTKESEDLGLHSTKGKSKSLNDPIIIIDGKKSNLALLKILEKGQIEEMKILKGKEAIKKYNSPGGVIIITTKSK